MGCSPSSSIAFVFFFGMLTAVEVFGAESKKGEAASAPEATTTTAPTTTEQQTSTAETSTAETTTTTAKPAETKVPVSETEFKIALGLDDTEGRGDHVRGVRTTARSRTTWRSRGRADKTKVIARGQ